MEKRKYYLLKEVILGLYKEYQQHQQELEKLKALCEKKEDRVEDFNFMVFKSQHKNPMLLCDYEPKQNRIQKLMTDFSKKTGYYIYGKNKAYLVTDNNRYYFHGHRGYPIHVKYNYGMEEEFYNQAKLILSSEFSHSMNSDYIEISNSDIDTMFHTDTRYIDFSINSSNNKLPKSVIWYDSLNNNLIFKSDNKELNNQDIENLLNFEIPSTTLNSYHIKTIHKSKILEKQVTISRITPMNTISLDIKEEEKQLILSKLRK